MRQKLLIRLQTDPRQAVEWLKVDADGHPEGSVESGSVAQAAEAAAGRRVVVLASSADLLITRAHLPTQSRAKLLKALPFALEEQLADDVEDLHFSPGAQGEDGRLPVVVASASQMDLWVGALDDANIETDLLTPDVFGLPYQADSWTVLVDDELFIVRTGSHTGFAGDVANLGLLLDLALQEAGEQKPDSITLYCTGDLPDTSHLDVEVDTRPLLENPLTFMALALDEKQAPSLLHGPYARKRTSNVQWKRWRPAAALFLAWVVLDTGSAWVQASQAQAKAETLQEQVVAAYRSAFPGNGRVSDPRFQMENRLNSLRRQGGKSDAGMLDMLHKLGPALVADSNLNIQAMNFRNGELELEITAPTNQSVNELKGRLDAMGGFEVEIRSLQAKGEIVEGRIRIGAGS